MAEVLPKNERTENILAQRAAADAAKNEKAEQVSPNLIRDLFWIKNFLQQSNFSISATVSEFKWPFLKF